MILETERLRLRPFREDDAADVYAYARDSRVGPIAGWPPHGSVEESRQIIRTVFSAPGTFAMELRESGQVIGSVGFVGRCPAGDPAWEDEIGYALGYRWWGRGLVPEAVEAVLACGFTRRGLRRVWCGHYGGNWRSARVIGKCGFAYRFSRTEAVPLLGQTRQCCYYAQTKEAWRERVSDTL